MATQPIVEPKRRRGFTPFRNDVLPDWPRLCSGSVQIFIVMYLNSETVGAARDRGTEPEYWSKPIRPDELAQYCRSTVRAVQLALASLVERKVIEEKGSTRGASRYHVPFDKWPDLPTVSPAQVISISGDAEESEADADQDAAAPAGSMPITEKPQTIRAGLRPRPKELPAAASKLRITTNADVQYTGSIHEGVLNIELAMIGEREANAPRNKFRSQEPKQQKTQVGTPLDHLFRELERTARKVGLSFSSFDLGKAFKAWEKLTPADHTKAIQGLVERHAAGEFNEPMYRPLLQNYLAKRMFDRAVRKPVGKADAKLLERQRNYNEALRMINEDEARKGGRR